MTEPVSYATLRTLPEGKAPLKITLKDIPMHVVAYFAAEAIALGPSATRDSRILSALMEHIDDEDAMPEPAATRRFDAHLDDAIDDLESLQAFAPSPTAHTDINNALRPLLSLRASRTAYDTPEPPAGPRAPQHAPATDVPTETPPGLAAHLRRTAAAARFARATDDIAERHAAEETE